MLSAAKHLLYLIEPQIKQILRGVYPEPLCSAQGRSQKKGERAQDDMSRRLSPQPVRLEDVILKVGGDILGSLKPKAPTKMYTSLPIS